MGTLDGRFGTVLRVMQTSAHAGERASAEARLTEFAARAGLSLEAAIKEHSTPKPAQPAVPNIFAGFNDWMEEKEPGYKARRAAEKADKVAAWQKRKAELIERAGSIEAVVEPCERETKLLVAVKPWRKARRGSKGRWTETLGGWRGHYCDRAPDYVRAAIQAAYPLPTTFAAAKAEWDYWEQRDRDLEDVLSDEWPPIGDAYLDLVADIRRSIVRSLAETELRLGNLNDVLARFAMDQADQSNRPEVVSAVYRDLQTLILGAGV